jgi:DNA-binding protein
MKGNIRLECRILYGMKNLMNYIIYVMVVKLNQGRHIVPMIEIRNV